MKKILISSFFLCLTLLSCKNENRQEQKISDFKSATTIEELMSFKDKITENEQTPFLNKFVVLNTIDSTFKKSNSFNRKGLIDFLDKNVSYSCNQLNTNKEIEKVLKSCKTKKEIFDKYSTLVGDGLNSYEIIPLTENVVNLMVTGCGTEDRLFKYESGKFETLDTATVNKNLNINIEKLQKNLKTTFKRQNGKYVTYDSTTIDGKKYFTIPFYEEIPGDDCSGCSYRYNLLIALNLEFNNFFYLYDNPKIKSDDWKNDADYTEQGSTNISEKNPNWLEIK